MTPLPSAGPKDELRKAAEFLIWWKDRGKPTDDAIEAWDALRAALAPETQKSAATVFGEWLNDGPRLAKAAGLYVGIKVSPASSEGGTP